MNSKIENAITALKSEGHSVEPYEHERDIWFEIDGWLHVSPQQMEDLAGRVCSLLELEDLFKQRRKNERVN